VSIRTGVGALQRESPHRLATIAGRGDVEPVELKHQLE
jgi:hypothetical protein